MEHQDEAVTTKAQAEMEAMNLPNYILLTALGRVVAKDGIHILAIQKGDTPENVAQIMARIKW